jgi:hypothetical protein
MPAELRIGEKSLNQRQIWKEKTMERREFLAALGTAAAVSSIFQVFAQTGGGSHQKVNVALFVRLEAKPGKEADVAEFLKGGLLQPRLNRRRLPGSAFVSDPQPSPSSTLFPMKPAGKRIWPEKWPPR